MATRKFTPKLVQCPSPAPVTFLPTLIDIKRRLDVTLCTLAVAAAALEHQAADIDLDVARVLRRSVFDPLCAQIDELDRIVIRLQHGTR